MGGDLLLHETWGILKDADPQKAGPQKGFWRCVVKTQKLRSVPDQYQSWTRESKSLLKHLNLLKSRMQ